jgi:hypothetical protein
VSFLGSFILTVGESFLVLFHHVYHDNHKVGCIMVIQAFFTLLKDNTLVRFDDDKLVSFRAVVANWKWLFTRDKDKIFTLASSEYHMVP